MSASVVHNSQDQEFVIEKTTGSAELSYSLPAKGRIDFTHTYVDEPLRGQGLGEELARAGLAFAREQKLQVEASCPFVQEFLDAHPEYHDLRAEASK